LFSWNFFGFFLFPCFLVFFSVIGVVWVFAIVIKSDAVGMIYLVEAGVCVYPTML